MGLTSAPIIAAEGFQEAYGTLIGDAAAALAGLPGLDLTIELITHQIEGGARSWYPGSALDMSKTDRAMKRTKFGGEKHVYDAATMRALRSFLQKRIAAALPAARILYWT